MEEKNKRLTHLKFPDHHDFTEKNIQGYQYTIDKNNIDDLYRTQGNIELGKQLASRAEVIYNKGTVDKYDFNTGEWNRVFGKST